ncbi:elicitor-responsive protein 1-like [Olea europaea var. sylvestris]|uniref:elicitor-responsive protein 1-like n=1 Tax=Olea europaea var. sylvestris TaxID=158386 RepID=UPI000C1D3D04|nr:elicitor-responsive protein 1-like [Olea europaea var. sylvestris]
MWRNSVVEEMVFIPLSEILHIYIIILVTIVLLRTCLVCCYGILYLQLVKGQFGALFMKFLKKVFMASLLDQHIVDSQWKQDITIEGSHYIYNACAGKGTSPVWNEKFEFRVDSPFVDDNQYKLVLKIMDHDTFSADDYLGEATIYVKDIIKIGVEEGKAELHPQKYRVVSTDQTYYGEIQVGITFTAKQKTVEEEEYGGWKESDY